MRGRAGGTSEGVRMILLAACLTFAPAVARAQPIDPYGGDDATKPAVPAATPPAGAVADDGDPEVDEAVAASLVDRAKVLMAQEDWADAQELLGEAIAQAPDGAAAADAKVLLDQVNAKLGITTAQQPPPVDHPPPVGPGGDEPPPVTVPPLVEQPSVHLAGKRFMWHVALMGAVTGGLIGYASSAENATDPMAPQTNTGKGILPGILIGGLGGLAIGTAFRHSSWIDGNDITVIDSFTAMGLVGSLSLGGIMQPVRGEAYAVNGVLGTVAGAVTGLVVAKHHDWSSRRMHRVDLWAATGATVPWLIYAIGNGSSPGAGRAAGFFSLAGLVGGAWFGFHQTRHWDHAASESVDAPMAALRRGSDGRWAMGVPVVAPSEHGATFGLLAGKF
jgi:hypothetical protein